LTIHIAIYVINVVTTYIIKNVYSHFLLKDEIFKRFLNDS